MKKNDALGSLKTELKSLSDPQKAAVLSRFFKTGSGQYAEGDVFLGLTSDQIKSIAKKYIEIDLELVSRLLDSVAHEHRACAMRILSAKFDGANLKKDGNAMKEIFQFYLGHTKFINNWDLVDMSAYIVGSYIIDRDKSILYTLAKSKNLWERRIAIVATYSFIRKNQFNDTIKISEILLQDKHDLIQKAVGWMLREMGKRDEKMLIKFLDRHYKSMPRTSLRYAIERLSGEMKRHYMKKRLNF